MSKLILYTSLYFPLFTYSINKVPLIAYPNEMSSHPSNITIYDNYRSFCEAVRSFILAQKASLTFNISIYYQVKRSSYLCISITPTLCSEISATVNNENSFSEKVSKGLSSRRNAQWRLQSSFKASRIEPDKQRQN